MALSWLSEVTNLRVWPICLGLLGCDLSGCATVCAGVAECVAVRENDVGRCVGACGCEVAASADRWRNATRAGPIECAYKQRAAKHQTGESFGCTCVSFLSIRTLGWERLGFKDNRSAREILIFVSGWPPVIVKNFHSIHKRQFPFLSNWQRLDEVSQDE